MIRFIDRFTELIVFSKICFWKNLKTENVQFPVKVILGTLQKNAYILLLIEL